jgi:uncharacterized surface protein with fasciclin (FAS1) repeats
MKTEMNMKQFHIKKWLFAIMATGILFTSCNKDVPTPEPIPGPPIPTGNTIGQVITTDTTYSYLLAAVTRVGLSDALFTQTLNFTVFAPNNAAFRASGIPSIAVINALPLSTLVPLTQYHILGFKMPGASIPETFPNTLALTLFAPPGAPAPFVRVSNFPSRRGTAGWVNNIPITQADIAASNGVIHSVARVLAPPSQTMSALITADTTLTFLKAAITRADSGQTGLNRLDSVLNTPIGPNLTLFAPNNNAFRALLTALGLPPSTAAFNFLSVQTVRAIVSYHGLGSRVFSPNIAATDSPVPTLLTAAIPGTTVTLNSTKGVKGLANPSFSNFLVVDRHGLNGTIFVIDQVLRFQ